MDGQELCSTGASQMPPDLKSAILRELCEMLDVSIQPNGGILLHINTRTVAADDIATVGGNQLHNLQKLLIRAREALGDGDD